MTERLSREEFERLLEDLERPNFLREHIEAMEYIEREMKKIMREVEELKAEMEEYEKLFR